MRPVGSISSPASIAASRSALAVVVIALFGCELTPESGNVGLAGPPPFFVEAASLAEGSVDVALNQPIAIVFNRYLDPDSFEYFNAVLVQSGGIGATGFTRYSLTSRSLTYYPTRDLRPSLIYTLSVNPDTVRALGGDELYAPFTLTFQTAAEGTVEQDRRVASRSFATDVAPVFAGRCGCHQSAGGLMPLSWERLVDADSEALPDRLLVRPYDPARSYLLHKLLPDFPDRRWTVMPPPWSNEPPLDPEDLIVIEEWIATGALP